MDTVNQDFPGGSDGKASAYNAGDESSIHGLGRSPWRRKWQPTPVLLTGKSHGWRSMAVYSPWSHKETQLSDLTQAVKGFDVLNKAEINVFLELSCFFKDPMDVGNLISDASAFLKSILNIWDFTVHVL